MNYKEEQACMHQHSLLIFMMMLKKHFQIQDSEDISSYAVFSDLVVNRQVQNIEKYNL